ncbi:MAG: Calx-beta domain-containing protein, partial [Hormoscilla sp.]
TYQVSEDGSVEGVAITIQGMGDMNGTSNVQIELSNGSATGGNQPFEDGVDFDNRMMPIELAPDQTTAVINIPINDDNLSEGTETLSLTLVNAQGMAIGSQNTAIVSIIDNETLPMSWDIDGSGETDASTDGLLLLKYMFGFQGDNLIDDSLAPNAEHNTATEIVSYLDKAMEMGMLDVDGNNKVDALSDGVLLIRYLSGSTGEDLRSGAIPFDATRSASGIFNHLQSWDL